MSQPNDKSSNPPFGAVDFAMLGVVLIWGGNFPIVKYALNEMLPLTFNGLRFALSTVFSLLLLVVLYRDLRIERGDWRRLLLLGLIGNTAYQILFIKGLQITRAGNSSLLVATNPIFIVLLSAALGTERISKRIWAGVLLCFVGIFVVITNSGKAFGIDQQTINGDLLTLAAAVCWASYAVFSRPLLARYPPVKLSAFTMLMGTPFILLAAIPDFVAQDWSAITWRGWLGLTYSFSLSISIAYIIYYQAIRVVGNARTAIYGNLVPVVALIVAAITLHERITPLQVVGAAIILAGIYLTRAGSKK
jgi:drug/metabolite transporter (DMT)-like permease